MNINARKQRRLLSALASLAALGIAVASRAGETSDEPHHHHHAVMTASTPVRNLARYEIPDVTLIDATGQRLSLRTVLADQAPLMLNFIFTTCTSICPVMSGVFAQVPTRLADSGLRTHLISISIDPEHDTPARLSAYASSYGASSDWTMLTGSLADSIAVQRAFDVYRGDKMNHLPTTFLLAGADQPWVRLDGLVSANDLVAEYRRLNTGKPSR